MGMHQLIRVLSILLAIVSGFMAICLGFSIAEGENFRMTISSIVPAALGTGSFIFMAILTRKDGKPFLSDKAGLLFVTLSWVLASCLDRSFCGARRHTGWAAWELSF